MLWSLVLNVATAGKLAEGYRGIPFGPENVLQNPPSEVCAYLPHPGVKWDCNQTIAGVNVTTTYSVEEGIFFMVGINVSTYTDSSNVMDVLLAAWGPGMKLKPYQTGVLPEWVWKDGDVMAKFTYNQVSGTGLIVIFDKVKLAEVDAKKAAKAASSAGDL